MSLKYTKGWSGERRAAQAQRCRTQKPWLHSTGPTSKEGKKVAALNSLKHGARSAAFNKLRAALVKNDKKLKRALKSLASQEKQNTSTQKYLDLRMINITQTRQLKNDERTERKDVQG
ncbi:MAG: hypothetical protein KTR28_04915 [Micavibrio sp.]|nr:hypothetical protein [Micavibrio sp.]